MYLKNLILWYRNPKEFFHQSNKRAVKMFLFSKKLFLIGQMIRDMIKHIMLIKLYWFFHVMVKTQYFIFL